MERLHVLHLLGIEDSNMVTVERLAAEVQDWRLGYAGNVELRVLLDRRRFDVTTLVRGAMGSRQVDVPRIDVIVNAICDPDTNGRSLAKAAQIVADTRRPVVNDPAAVMATSRDQVAAQLQDLPGVRVPWVRRLAPRRIAEVRGLVDAGELAYPFLFRAAGRHGGEAMVLLRGDDDLVQLEQFALDGSDFYAIEFLDCRSPRDGRYRKYRVIVVGGIAYPKHLIVSEGWNIHLRDRAAMVEDPALMAEEAEFLASPPAALTDPLAAMAERLRLDYFGGDVTLDADGQMVVFEVNACMRPLRTRADALTADPAHAHTNTAIVSAFNELVRRRATEAADRGPTGTADG